MPDYFIFADIIGIIAFGISGFLIAIKNNLDILGIVIASALTALGGGIIRDAILSSAPFAFTSLYPAITLIFTIFIAYMFKLYNNTSIEKKWIFVVSDTIGLVAFSITGALLAINAEYNFFGIIILSFITAVGGGVTRDIMINEVPTVLVSDFYGSIAVIVALLLAVVELFDMLNEFTIISIALFCIALRLIAYKKKWHLPKLN
ncbi:MAG: trimeric intracellular cation channel family protein [Sulfurimonas sp.]|uniref:trimeric intracellular cation channel family protein n=1 Tax=Sulfurimonas sp. TaxID=2022749 RepID=UPI00261313D4|nr:trimeric intracellular cation channel family protein [Sulfurimonas sp.]MCW8895911.1 trimeric intracellular cation channel family protein [Sulfurimonas sp.]MCW8954489.1 trimeric intracellular cation channel family protein [Sulfurimonas sp.]MCW9067897.1 trimeric intracellular cation channel family protein [Sulfurimonas sp.]